jgi:predicted dienelactone hydrolase
VRRFVYSSGMIFLLLLVSAGLAGPPSDGPGTKPAASGQPYRDKAGPYAVEAVKYEWQDAERDREVPVEVYYPKSPDRPCPIIIFSHGLGGSRESYEYLGRHWAGYGYVCVHPQHKGSDSEVLKGSKAERLKAMLLAAADPKNAVDRAKDVSFVIDELTKANKEKGPLHKLMDMRRIGVSGHSFGANTTLAIAGEVFVGPRDQELRLADKRVKAAIAMSSPVPGSPDRYDQAFGEIEIPCLHMTGTKDVSPIRDTPVESRRIPFDRIHRADQFLLTFEGGDHMVFGVQRQRRGGEKDARFHDLILQSSTAFWDAYLRDDAKAKKWLTGGGFEAVLGGDGKFEKKLSKLPQESAASRDMGIGQLSRTPAMSLWNYVRARATVQALVGLARAVN